MRFEQPASEAPQPGSHGHWKAWQTRVDTQWGRVLDCRFTVNRPKAEEGTQPEASVEQGQGDKGQTAGKQLNRDSSMME